MRTIYYFLLFLLLPVSCRGPEENPPAPEPETELPLRTIIVYLCGDNDLSSEIDTKIEALQQGMKPMGETDNHLIVYADYHDQMPKLLEVTSSDIVKLEQYAERNSASAANFSEIVRKIMQDFQAQSYGLICFSHGSGWLPPKALNNPSGFASASSSPAFRTIFEDNGYEMSLTDFASAIPLTPKGDKMEFILLEACYMAGAEVVYELRDKTKWILASAAEMLSPGWKDIYPSHLADLFQPEPQLKNFAQAYFDYRNNLTGAARSATISLICPNEIEELASEVKEILSGANTENVSGIQYFNRNDYALFFDLSDYMGTQATPEQRINYEETLSKIVVFQAATYSFMSGYPHSFLIRKHCGLTTYIEQAKYPELNGAYRQLGWSRAIESE